MGLFSTNENPISLKLDPNTTAINLVNYLNGKGYDGIDVNIRDNNAFKAGTAEAWLISFTRKVK